MKIFYLITKSTAGGAQTHVFQLSKYFIEKGDEVGVMSHPGGWLEERVKKMGGKFYPNDFLANTPNPFKILKAVKEIKRAIQDFKPNLVSCHSTMTGFLGRLVIKNKIPTLFTAHGWGFVQGVPFLRRYLIPFVEKIAARWASKIICVSEFDRKLALKYKIAPEEKIITVHNGVEISINRTNQHRSAFIKIVFVGRLGRQKDPLLLVRGFNKLSSQLKNKAQIFIIGEGQKRKELEKFIGENKLEEKVKLLGNLPRERVFEVLGKSDIFVLTSNWEGFPRSILEAMSCGLAIIASDVGGINEAINKNCGILIKKGDKLGLKRALEKLLKNPELIQEMGEKARERVRERFSLEKMLKATARVYQGTLLSKIMQGLILAGGRGKRMKPLSNKIPKPLLPVGGKPFLAHLIDFLKNQGVNEFILAVGYEAQKIEDYFGKGEKFGVKIIYSKEKKPLDTGGAVKNAENLIKGKNILVFNGDSFIDIDIKKMLEFHKRKELPITIAVRKIKNPGRYGRIAISKENIITKFEEKNKIDRESLINGGAYIFQTNILKDFPKNKKLSLERDIFPRFVGKIAAFQTKGYFIDIGIPEDYKRIKRDFKRHDPIN